MNIYLYKKIVVGLRVENRSPVIMEFLDEK
jgi:hypothetical protein